MDTPIDVDEDNQWKHDSEFVKIIKNMFYIQFFKRNRLGMVSNMSEASKSCSSTSTTSTRPSPTSAIHVFDDFDELAVVLPLAVFVLFFTVKYLIVHKRAIFLGTWVP